MFSQYNFRTGKEELNWFFVLVAAGIIGVFIMMIIGGIQQMNCKHPVYVDGMECRGTETYKTCRQTKLYDGCND